MLAIRLRISFHPAHADAQVNAHAHAHLHALLTFYQCWPLYLLYVCRQAWRDAIPHFSGSLPFLICDLSMGWSLLKFPWNYLRWPCAHLPGGPLIYVAELGQQRQGQTKTLEFDLQFLSKMLVPQARSDQFAFKSNIPSPARFEQIKHNSSSLQYAKSTVSPSLIIINCCFRKPQPCYHFLHCVNKASRKPSECRRLFPQATAQPSAEKHCY